MSTIEKTVYNPVNHTFLSTLWATFSRARSHPDRPAVSATSKQTIIGAAATT
jgi:hypothetical protein